jgi:hypothetical protein
LDNNDKEISPKGEISPNPVASVATLPQEWMMIRTKAINKCVSLLSKQNSQRGNADEDTGLPDGRFLNQKYQFG